MKKEPKAEDDKRIKTIVWKCEYGCGAANTRIFAFRHIVNDDMCDVCGKVYHEPSTLVVEVK